MNKNQVLLAAIGLSISASLVLADNHPTGAPVLNSNPGAAYTVYLDFGGFNYSGNWSTYTPGTVVPFDNASLTGSYSTTEQNDIKEVFARVSEKYVGMNVNVTTVDPAVAAGQSGTDSARQAYYDTTARLMHTIITSSTPTQSPIVAAGGGISFLGTTQNSYSTTGINGGAGAGYHTNWVFTDSLANQGTGTVAAYSLKYIGEAGSHENGHGFQLVHQSAYNGTTKTAEYSDNGASALVAPIMGDSYGSARGTWRSGATTSGSTVYQNDIAVLLSNSGNNNFNDDAVGHSLVTASTLNLTAGGALTAGANHGFITPLATTSYNPVAGENGYTKDYYRFVTTGGALTLTENESADLLAAGVADPGGMLDSTFRLLDAAGNTILSVANPATQSNTISTTLAAGAYYLQVVSAGGKAATTSANSNETANYFDMGSYFLSGSIAVPEPAMGLTLILAIGGLIRRRRRAV